MHTGLFKVSEFSRMAGVSVRTLHHYDEVGLLSPAALSEGGHRLYASAQLAELRRIVTLRALGLGLKEVRQVLNGAPYLDRLERRRAELAQQLRAVEAAISTEISKEKAMNDYPVELKDLPQQHVIAARETAPDYRHVTAPMGRAYVPVCAAFDRLGLRRAGPDTIVWHGGGYQSEESIELECALPVEALPDEMVAPAYGATWAPLTVASVMHHGSYERFGEAYAALLAWMATEDYAPDGPVREVYHVHGRTDDEHVSELQIPVRRA